MIEGNRLTREQVTQVIEHQEHFPGRERDEKEVLGYYAALEKREQLTAMGGSIKEAGNITSRDVAGLFGISERAARNLLAAGVDHAFLTITGPAKKSRKYGPEAEFKEIPMGMASFEKRPAR